jgi:hypothetical protein
MMDDNAPLLIRVIDLTVTVMTLTKRNEDETKRNELFFATVKCL